MKGCLTTLWAVLSQFLLALVGQPVPGLSQADREQNARKRRRLEAGKAPVSAFTALRTVAREALLALTGQPSPRSSASRRRPRP